MVASDSVSESISKHHSPNVAIMVWDPSGATKEMQGSVESVTDKVKWFAVTFYVLESAPEAILLKRSRCYANGIRGADAPSVDQSSELLRDSLDSGSDRTRCLYLRTSIRLCARVRPS